MFTCFFDVDGHVVPLLRHAFPCSAGHFHLGSATYFSVADLNLERTSRKLGSVLDHIDHVSTLLLRLEATKTCEKFHKLLVRLTKWTSIRYVHAATTRSSAVPVIAGYTAYDVRYSYRPLSGISVVSVSIYLFTVSNWSLLLMPIRFSADHCALWLNDTSYWKSVWRSK